MKGVILAGGLGTRLYPLTYATNKHLLPVFDQPMVFYPIQTLVNAGITEVLLVVGGPHAGHFMRVLKNGKELGLTHLEYAYQEKEGGIAQALGLARDFCDGDSMAVILGDNTTDADIRPAVKKFKKGAAIFLREVPDPARYGVPVFAPDGRTLLRIEEKPEKPLSSKAVTGLYLYDSQVFDIISRLKPSNRGELEITDVNNAYLKNGQLQWFPLEGFWLDAGKFETLFQAGEYWAKKKSGPLED